MTARSTPFSLRSRCRLAREKQAEEERRARARAYPDVWMAQCKDRVAREAEWDRREVDFNGLVSLIGGTHLHFVTIATSLPLPPPADEGPLCIECHRPLPDGIPHYSHKLSTLDRMMHV